MRAYVTGLLAGAVLVTSAACPLAKADKACPGRFQECLGGCIPENGVCCDNGSYCLSPTTCDWGGFDYTCSNGGYHEPRCPVGQRHCGTECKPNGSQCCIGDECMTLLSADSRALCEVSGRVLCGICPRSGLACSGQCQYCAAGSLCAGDLCGELRCCNDAGVCGPPSRCDAAGAGGGGGTSGPCPGGWMGSMATWGAVGLNDACAGSGSTNTCISGTAYQQATGRTLPAACLAQGGAGCLDTGTGTLVHPCCPGLTCVYRERCGAAASATGGQCLQR